MNDTVPAVSIREIPAGSAWLRLSGKEKRRSQPRSPPFVSHTTHTMHVLRVGQGFSPFTCSTWSPTQARSAIYGPFAAASGVPH